jgi:DNA-directed RNA polymerase specialized sigma24 family protein
MGEGSGVVGPLTVGQRLQGMWGYRPRLVGLASRMGVGWDAAEDVASEALVRAACARALAGGVGDPLPYLYVVVVNLARDELRRAARDAAAGRDMRLVPRQRMVEDDVVVRDRAAWALRRLWETEPAVTVAMVVRLVDGDLSWAQLADEFGMSVSAAQSRVWRALVRLRARLLPTDS